MIVLAFDTSSPVVSVALCDDDHVLARRDVEAPPKVTHVERLFRART